MSAGDFDELVVTVDDPADVGERADVVLGRRLPGVSRRIARRLALEGHLRIGGRRALPSTRVALGTRLSLAVARQAPAPPATILEVTERFVYALKPAGLHTHRLRPDDASTVADAVAVDHPECRHASPDPRQGGAVHRLDRGTTGVVAFARTLDAWRSARAGFRARQVIKIYRADVLAASPWPPAHRAISPTDEPPPPGPWPPPREPGVEIDLSLGPAGRHRVAARETGRAALTLAWALPPQGPHQPLLLRLVTGHRHQARVHLATVDRPIVGDITYGGAEASPMRLHAAVLDLSPACPSEPRVIAPLPAAWSAMSEPSDA